MSIFKNIFTWWEGAGFGTTLMTAMRGRRMGTDGLGNVYFEGKKAEQGRHRRWVIYNGSNDASRVPPELPDVSLPVPRAWELPATPNLTGTASAYKPAGALETGGKRAAATGDYQAWSPEGA
jgi:NADH:ubiquinone oxidoreductase subunit